MRSEQLKNSNLDGKDDLPQIEDTDDLAAQADTDEFTLNLRQAAFDNETAQTENKYEGSQSIRNLSINVIGGGM